MPEIKNNFIQAKMNKDLDERLVPNGEYRNAVNIQVSTSDGSNVGAIENIKGNEKAKITTNPIAGSRCVGSIADESKNVIYWFNSSPSSGEVVYNLEDDPNSGIIGWSLPDSHIVAQVNTWWQDIIYQHNSFNDTTLPVFVDNFMVKVRFDDNVSTLSGINRNNTGSGVFGSTDNKHFYTLDYEVSPSSPIEQISVGMLVYFFIDFNHGGNSLNGSGPYSTGDMCFSNGEAITRTVVAVDVDANGNTCVIFDKDLSYEHNATATHNGITYGTGFKQVSGIPNANYMLFTKKRLLNFDTCNVITGINTLYDFLIWTDNDAEPKKLHVPRSILGTNPNGLKSTRLIVPERGISTADDILVKEENISVIKKYPKNKPLVEEKIEFALTATTAYNFVNQVDPNSPTTNQLLSEAGDIVIIQFDNFIGGNNFIIGEEIRFLETSLTTLQLPDDYSIRCKVLENISNTTEVFPQPFPQSPITISHGPNTYRLEILSISPNTVIVSTTNPQNNPDPEFNVERILDTQSLFEKNMARFGYRWRYQDGEYSTFSPFSDIVFEPGEFNYDSKKAYNKAMQNHLIRLTLRKIIANDMPDDVVQVDILYVDSNSPNVYVVDKLRYNDYAHVSIGTQMYNHWKSDQYEIKSDIIFASVPENQSFRSWDNVPRKALAQEVTGNRLVYGNYLQNYTLRNNYEGLYEKPVLETSLDDRWSPFLVQNPQQGSLGATIKYKVLYNDTYLDEQALNFPELNYPFLEPEALENLFGNPSLKSNRKYQLGFTYLDEYGRETPVFSNSEATVDVTKKHADGYTLLASKVVSFPPSWATDFRMYVKETSNEYYNVVMDRVYNAEDGNLWLSFPSSERNKIQEDTFLILKKPADSDALVEEEGKYKVVSIENEVPDYLKRKQKLVIKAAGDQALLSNAPPTPPITHIFTTGPSNTPLDTLLSPLNKIFKIESTRLSEETAIQLQDAGVSIFDFKVGSQYSRKYNIVNITNDIAGSEYTITLDKNIDSSEDWMYSDPATFTYDVALELSFYKETIDIKPEFFGKFFVKIEGDGLAGQYLNTNVEADTFYGVINSFNFFYVSDTDAPGVTTGTANLQNDLTNTGSSGNGEWDYYQSSGSTVHQPNDPNDSTDGQLDWLNVFDFGGLQGNAQYDPLSQWFIDEAFYAGVHPTGNHNGPNNPNHVSATNGNFGYGKGVYNSNSQNYIELSFGQLEPESGVGSGLIGVGPNQTINYADFNESFIWEVGSSQNPIHASQNSVTKNLIPGSQFRFVGDQNGTIYTISDNVSIEKIRRYNHTQWGEVQYRFNQWHATVTNANPGGDQTLLTNGAGNGYEDVWTRFAAADNRRLTYVIPVDKDVNSPSGTIIGGDSLTDPDKGSSATNVATQPQTIQFIEQRKDEDADVISSSNPVIFETEPKEAIDLDIFYQASDSYPTKLTIETAEQWVPLGSVVVCKSHPYVVSATPVTFVTGWELNNYGELMLKFNNPLDVNGMGLIDTETQQSLVLTFVRPDNSYTTLRGDWVNYVTVPLNGASGPAISLSINNQTPAVSSLFSINSWKETAYRVNIGNVVSNKIGISWFNTFSYGNGVESDRIRDLFNEKRLSKGVKVSTTIDEPYEEERRSSGLIYSGIYNSISGVNNLNQFIQAEKITKDLNPTYGSIQKLFSRETDLISFCEDRVIRIAANKDAIFNADGNPQLIATNNVLGQTMPFSGDFGISKNPESFAKESYRAYFTDAKNGTVLRLSKDGLTPISDYGMKDYFIGILKNNDNHKIIGSYDDKKNLYNLSINKSDCNSLVISYGDQKSTVSYSEKNKGWETFKSFEPEQGLSLSGEYYTFKQGYIYKHHVDGDRNTFYNNYSPSSVTFLFNASPSTVKSFNTLNYEGTQASVIVETAHPAGILSNSNRGFYNLTGKDGWLCTDIKTNKQDGDVQEFIEKEGKWFNYIKGKKL